MAEPRSPHPNWIRIGTDFVTIEIVARPGSQRRGLLRIEARGLVIGLAAAPEQGKANDELLATIAEVADVARTEVTILRGAGTRNKVVRIASSDPATLASHIARLEAKQR